jgi:hypothetical protein
MDEPGNLPLLALLEQLAALALREGVPAGPLVLKGLRLEPDALVLLVGARGLAGRVVAPLGGVQAVRLAVLETSPERTRFALSLPAAPGLGRLVSLGLRALPRAWVDEALRGLAGDALRLEGGEMLLEHRALLARLRERAHPSAPGAP